MSDYLLEIKHVSKSFANHKIINDVNLKVQAGEFVTFLGPSGCGKTTLLRMIAGFYDIDEGEIILEGKRIDNVAPQKRGTPMVFQEYALFPHFNVFENIAYGLKIKQLNKAQIKEKVAKVMDLLNLQGMEKRFPNQMSGGQQQRVAIARALVNDSKLILLDEPLSNLDAKLRESVRVELRQIQRKLGLTMIYVTHDQQEALSMSDKIVVLQQGVVMEIGVPQSMYYQPKNSFVASFIGTTNFLAGQRSVVNGQSAIKYLGQTIYCDEPECKDENLILSIRPESICLAKSALPNNCVIEAKVVDSSFLGEKMRYFLEDSSKKMWIVDEFDVGTDVKKGELYLNFPAHKAHVVREDRVDQI